jgi:hypothetical protein
MLWPATGWGEYAKAQIAARTTAKMKNRTT